MEYNSDIPSGEDTGEKSEKFDPGPEEEIPEEEIDYYVYAETLWESIVRNFIS